MVSPLRQRAGKRQSCAISAGLVNVASLNYARSVGAGTRLLYSKDDSYGSYSWIANCTVSQYSLSVREAGVIHLLTRVNPKPPACESMPPDPADPVNASAIVAVGGVLLDSFSVSVVGVEAFDQLKPVSFGADPSKWLDEFSGSLYCVRPIIADAVTPSERVTHTSQYVYAAVEVFGGTAIDFVQDPTALVVSRISPIYEYFNLNFLSGASDPGAYGVIAIQGDYWNRGLDGGSVSSSVVPDPRLQLYTRPIPSAAVEAPDSYRRVVAPYRTDLKAHLWRISPGNTATSFEHRLILAFDWPVTSVFCALNIALLPPFFTATHIRLALQIKDDVGGVWVFAVGPSVVNDGKPLAGSYTPAQIVPQPGSTKWTFSAGWLASNDDGTTWNFDTRTNAVDLYSGSWILAVSIVPGARLTPLGLPRSPAYGSAYVPALLGPPIAVIP